MDIQEIIGIVEETERFFYDDQASGQVTVKGRADYVTEADLRVQEYLKGALAGRYPDIQFMGEEKDNGDIDFSGRVWILDPVDGTTNLIHHYHHSAVSLGLYEGGKGVLGIIFQPFHKEMFYASAGAGAFLNGFPIHVSEADRLEDSLMGIGTNPYDKGSAKENFRKFERVFGRCLDIRRSGSAAMDLAYVACGRLDAYFEQNLKPWDMAAGLVILREAKGEAFTFDGGEISVEGPSDLACGHGPALRELLRLIASDQG